MMITNAPPNPHFGLKLSTYTAYTLTRLATCMPLTYFEKTTGSSYP